MFDQIMEINGFELRARYTRGATGQIAELADKLVRLHDRLGRPAIALLAAPPGAGKSTLAQAICETARQCGQDIVPLGLDGFHYSNAYLDTHFTPDGQSLRSVKGAPCTYDIEHLRTALGQLRSGSTCWPYYDRRLHDPAPDAPQVSGDMFIVEGNWLLLDAPGWNELRTMCDLSIAIDAPDCILLSRLIARKVRGGLLPEQAREFCLRSDMANIRLYRARRLSADIELQEAEAEGEVDFRLVSAARRQD